MTPDPDAGYYVMPKSQWNNATVHHPAPEATREDPTPLCDVSTDTEPFRVADDADRERYGLCRVCAATVNDDPDPRGNHGQSGRSPADILRENGFDVPEDSTGGSA
jgi:hypothetical protein